MSHQPSTLDNVRSAAANVTHTIADGLDPAVDTKQTTKTDAQGTQIAKGSAKDQLDEAAKGTYTSDKQETTAEKVAAYVPGLSSIHGTRTEDETKTEPDKPNDGEPPQRPHHDVQVSEFIREQYKSKSGNAMPEV